MNHHQHLVAVDYLWRKLLMCLLGNTFDEHSDCINGCFFTSRKYDRIQLEIWVSAATDRKISGGK